jgi:nitrate reductase gamma subunit
MFNNILLMVFPYLAVVVAVTVSIYRYKTNKFHFSSLSSEFLENNELFWGSVPWHYGIITVLLAHLFGIFFPSQFLAFNSVPVRLYILEATGLMMGVLALVGIVILMKRRMTNKRLMAVTSRMDRIILFVLLIQVLAGVSIAITYRWGSNWYATSMAPYLQSLLKLQPNLGYVTTMPLLVKFHIVNGFFIIILIPFTRFMHFLILPLNYPFRKWQIVMWNWDPKKIRKTLK